MKSSKIILAVVLLAGSNLFSHEGHDHLFQSAYAGKVEKAHNVSAFSSAAVIKTDLVVSFGGSERINGTLTMTPSTSATRIDQKSGTTMVWDGSHAWVSPAASEQKMARFHLLTWPYFFAVPFKLQDPGTHLEDLGLVKMGENEYSAAKLTFGENVGDAPDDWYIVYTDPKTSVVQGLAYIVTYGKNDAAAATSEPHGIRYHDYVTVAGLAVPTRWTFHDWSEVSGFGEEIGGEAKLSNVELLASIPEGHFSKPADCREDVLPTPE